VHGIATKKGNANPSINGWGPMLAFNHIVEFFQNLWKFYQKVWMKKCKVCKSFNITHIRTYKRHMNEWKG
jgi:hypothetical protein